MYQKGFTLVEILFVVIIIAGLLAFAYPAYKRAQARASYEKATGLLIEVGAAVQAMKREIQSRGGGITFPSSEHGEYASSRILFQEEDGTSACPSADVLWCLLNEDSWHTSGESFTDSDRDAFLWGLVSSRADATDQKESYISTLSRDGAGTIQYSMFAPRANSTRCEGKCKGANVVVCMCKPSYEASDCFYGARYYEDGSLKRIAGESCSN